MKKKLTDYSTTWKSWKHTDKERYRKLILRMLKSWQRKVKANPTKYNLAGLHDWQNQQGQWEELWGEKLKTED